MVPFLWKTKGANTNIMLIIICQALLLRSLHPLIRIIHSTTQKGRYYYTHLTADGTEAQRG